MGRPDTVKRYVGPDRPIIAELPKGLVRRRPRRFAEWKALRAWGKLPSWEIEPVGYLLREAREGAGLTQTELARRLGCSQQAVAQAERWEGNPTVEFIRRWATACGSPLKITLEVYTPERKAELLLANAVDADDRRRADKEMRKLGPDPRMRRSRRRRGRLV
jgi:transcriptional regulator with XRE-family HTH domain